MIAPGLLMPMVSGTALLLAGGDGPWWPPRTVAATRGLAALFFANDVAIVLALVSLLISREDWSPHVIIRPFPFSERWLWSFLVAFLVLAYVSLSPMFLFLLVRMKP